MYKLIHLFLFTIIISNARSLVYSRPVGLGFKWEATLDADGLANSLESSSMPMPMQQDKESFCKAIISKAESEFIEYPFFLGRKNVLFGLFTAKSDSEQMTQIQDSIFGINLLTFGEPKTTVFSDRSENEQRRGVLVKLPVVGGLLACFKEANSNHDALSLGELSFQIAQTRSKQPGIDDTLQVETRVINYLPSIAGRPPINFLRKSLYLNSQRYLHAYVMWRFHKHCYNKVVD